MNFLAHFFYDRSGSDGYYHLGLLLPDLIRNFCHEIQRPPANPNYANAPEIMLWKGYQKHQETDKVFHQTEQFVHLTKQATLLLRNSTADFPRDWFLAHILVELMLDRVILTQHPDTATQLYQSLRNTDRAFVEPFLHSLQVVKTDAFFNGFNRFMEVQYLTSYKSAESVAYAIGRIAQTVNVHISDSSHKLEIISVILQMEDNIITFMQELSLKLGSDNN